MCKRLLDVFGSALGLILLSPVFLLLALLIKSESAGPVFFRQVRVGRGGTIFRIHKFRTMVARQPGDAPLITVGGDLRITRVGRYLREYKLDELAQLIDVLTGDMSLVGPRPEVEKYVALYPAGIREVVLGIRPGLTDRASIEFKDEARLLALSHDPERTYVEEILPRKLDYYCAYAKHRSCWLDIQIMFQTLLALARPVRVERN
jgi:lipopolysaccharide/colanic/teichoic acid biosynthesis glycosyltransferase